MNIPLNTCGQREPPRSSGEETQFQDRRADHSNSPFHLSEENEVRGKLLRNIDISLSVLLVVLYIQVCVI